MQIRKKKLLLGLTLVIATIVAGACGPRPTPEPTVDINQLATEAMVTIEAKFTETALAMPTDTPEPTYTPIVLTPTIGTIPQLPTAGVGNIPAAPEVPTIPAVVPTATLSDIGNKSLYVGQNIADGTHFSPGEEDDLVWTFQNVGTTTWTKDYNVRFYTGDNFAKNGRTRFPLTKDVPPQAEGSAIVDIVAPTKPGTYEMVWVLSDDGDNNFGVCTLKIIVD